MTARTSALYVEHKGTKSDMRGEPKGERPAANKGDSRQSGPGARRPSLLRQGGTQPESAAQVQEPSGREPGAAAGRPKQGHARQETGEEESKAAGWRSGTRGARKARNGQEE